MALYKQSTKQHILWPFFILVLMIIMLPINIFASTIKGKITDKTTGENLAGVNVIVEGSSIGSASDVDGNYTIFHVPEGTHNLIFSYIGYEKRSLEVQVGHDEVLIQDMELTSKAIAIGNVTVTAQAKGQMSAINQQVSAETIKNIVSSDKIEELPDANAAESIGRLPGVALKRSGGEGNFVIVRGLDARYTDIKVNGVKLTGSGSNRAVGLSFLTSEMLGGIELSKTLTADQDADAMAGVVNLKLKKADPGFHYSARLFGGYNGMESSFGDYKLSGIVSNRFFDNKLGVLLSGVGEQVSRPSDGFGAGYETIIANTDQLYTTSANISERLRNWNRMNGSVILDYKTDFMKIQVNNIFTNKKEDNETRSHVFAFHNSYYNFNISDSKPVQNIRTHSLQTVFNLFNTELNVDASYSNTSSENEVDLYNFRNIDVLDGLSITASERFFKKPSELIDEFYGDITGEKSVFTDNVRSIIEGEDETQTYGLDWKIPFNLMSHISGYLKLGGKYSKKEHMNNRDNIQCYYWGGIGQGRMTEIYNNGFPHFTRVQDLNIADTWGIPAVNFIDEDYDYGEVLNGRYELGWSADLEYLKFVQDSIYRWKGSEYYYQQGVQSSEDDFKTTEEKSAGYIMAELNIGERVTIIPGVRYEDMRTEYHGKYILEDPFNPVGIGFVKDVSSKRKNHYWFPSVNMKVKINEWSDLRAAYYESCSRPSYILLSPSLVANQDKTNLSAKNPFLEPELSTNYDLGISLHSSKMGLLTIDGYYKEMSNLISSLPVYRPTLFDKVEAPESVMNSLQEPRKLYDDNLINDGTRIYGYPFNAPNKAYVSGIEVSLQTNFWYLPGLLSGLVAEVNFSKIWSNTRNPYLEFTEGVDTTGFFPKPITIPVYQTRKEKMNSQPGIIYNARLGWDYKGFSSRLSFRYQQENVTATDPLHNFTKRFRDDKFRIDLQIKQQITKGLSAFISCANLNEAIDDSYLEADKYSFPTSSEFYGFTAQFGLNYKF